MKRINLLLIFFILFFAANITTAQKYTISGYVQDMRSGEKIARAFSADPIIQM